MSFLTKAPAETSEGSAAETSKESSRSGVTNEMRISQATERLLQMGKQTLNEIFWGHVDQIGLGELGSFKLRDVPGLIEESSLLKTRLDVNDSDIERWQRAITQRGFACGDTSHLTGRRCGRSTGRAYQGRIKECESSKCSRYVCQTCRQHASQELEGRELEDLEKNMSSTCRVCELHALVPCNADAGFNNGPCICAETLQQSWLCRSCREMTLQRINSRAAERKSELQLTGRTAGRTIRCERPKRAPACRCGRTATRTQHRVMFCRACDGVRKAPDDDTKYPAFPDGNEARGHDQ